MPRRRLDAPGVILALLGAGSLGNGAWMLLDTARWFGSIAADTGPLNLHLVRDVGAAYAAAGVALLLAARRPSLRLPLTAVAAVFLVLHALGHVFETLSGALPARHWLEDAPGVYLPALLTLLLSARFARRSGEDH